jgi:peptide/nickel transport system substrate-binding protein
MSNSEVEVKMSRMEKISIFRISALLIFLSTMSIPHGVDATTVHITASAPWRAYADPLSDVTGSPLLPAVFDSLTIIESDGTLSPALAESWANDNGTVWTFKLRPNVLFSDGSPLDATAVVDCLSMLIGPSGQSYSPFFFTSEISGVRVLSDDEIEITTRQKDARLARKLSNVSIFSVPEFKRLGRTEFSKLPVGTGPFTPVSWSNNGARVLLKRVPTSWRVSTEVDQVEITVITDSTARLQNILSDGTDIALNIDPDQISTIKSAGFNVSVRPGPIVLALALRTSEGAMLALQDRRVRMALNMAINREGISQHLLSNTMEPATQLGTPEALGYDPEIEPYAYDPDRAMKLLAEAGYSNGFELSGTVMTGQFPGDTLIFQKVVQDLEYIGISVVLGTLPVIEFIRRRNANDWNGIDIVSTLLSHYRNGDISGAAEMLSCYEPRSTFCDPTMDEMLIRSHQEMNATAREELLRSINSRLQYLAPIILITRYSAIDALSKRISKYPEFPAGKMRFEQMEVIEY